MMRYVVLLWVLCLESVREEDGKAVCKCKPGFRDVPGHGCMDDSAPALKLKGPAELIMKQCEKYVERGVEVMDSNSENDDRYERVYVSSCHLPIQSGGGEKKGGGRVILYRHL